MSKTNGNVAVETVETEAKPELSAAEKVKLFEAYEAAKQKLDAHEAKGEALKDAVSATVKVIADKLGGSAKLWKGRTVYPVKAGKGERWVMRGERQNAPEAIG